MSSGSYQAQAVKIVMIPKVKGGMRKLGIPMVTDRVAQTVIKNRLEKTVEEHFHKDSYGYRTGRSAIDAVVQARQRCMKYEWVVEVDIKSFFDELDHELLMGILRKYTEDKVVLLYSERFLKAEARSEAGEVIIRDKGTPQGGVVSPVLANLFLHPKE
jgi:RNA-directed DNA polymerase